MNAEIMLQLIIKRMKKIILFLLAFAAIKSFGQTDEQKVLDRVKQLNTAIFINRDSAALEGLMADKVTYGHSSAKIENRSEMIAGAIHSPSTYKNFMMDSATVFFWRKEYSSCSPCVKGYFGWYAGKRIALAFKCITGLGDAKKSMEADGKTSGETLKKLV